MQADDRQIEAQPRQEFGKRARYLRRKGIVPANINGGHAESQAVQVPTRRMEHVLSHVPRTSLLTVNVEGSAAATVLVKGVDRKPTTGELYHVEFQRVVMTELIRMDVPIVLSGEAPAAQLRGATILHALNAVHVEALPGNLPGEIPVDLSALREIDDAIHVRDLPVPRGVTLLTDGDELIVKALSPQLVTEEPVAMAAGAPELIEPTRAEEPESEAEPEAEPETEEPAEG